MSRSGEDPMPDDVTETQAETPPRVMPVPSDGSRFQPSDGRTPAPGPIFDVNDVSVFYGEHRAIRDVSMSIARNEITALIGPSGCGKSTFIRCLNRMNDLIPSARVEGSVVYHDEDLYDPRIDPVQVRKRI